MLKKKSKNCNFSKAQTFHTYAVTSLLHLSFISSYELFNADAIALSCFFSCFFVFLGMVVITDISVYQSSLLEPEVDLTALLDLI